MFCYGDDDADNDRDEDNSDDDVILTKSKRSWIYITLSGCVSDTNNYPNILKCKTVWVIVQIRMLQILSVV